jgi:hypothetical protein
MNYLKNIIPKMFQSTLSVLSKSLIQQFLDELSWRERWGSTPSLTFETIMTHIVEMTTAEMGETLISRLNKISLNPFAEWGYSAKTPKGVGPKQGTSTATLPKDKGKSIVPKESNAGKRKSNSSLQALDNLGQLAASFMRGANASPAGKQYFE